MDEIIEYKRFSGVEKARVFTDLLDVNYIWFSVDSPDNDADNAIEEGIGIQIRATDKDRVDELYKRIAEISVTNDNYMYSLSDNDIIDAVVNPREWTSEEHLLAKEIMKQRKLLPTASSIKASRTEKNKDESNSKLKQDRLITGGASWFLLIGIISMLNVILFIARQDLQFVFGLGVNYIILGVADGIKKALGINAFPIAYVFNFLISAIFLFIWRKSKSENKTVYLIGLILYGLDSLTLILSQEWLNFGFHVFALLVLANGYSALLAKKRELQIIV